jgi:hypothetical protein
MRYLTLTIIAFLHCWSVMAQSVKPANVYPSNLEENMYFESYVAATKTIKGLYFMVLSDGDNSQDITPEFKVKLYLIPAGSTSESDVIIVKTYELPGQYHMGSREYKNVTLNLSEFTIAPGTYRLGIWVNAEKDFAEDETDNAMLFKGNIIIKEASSSEPAVQPAEEKKKEEKTDEWGW